LRWVKRCAPPATVAARAISIDEWPNAKDTPTAPSSSTWSDTP
jgi:hypothetical protein